MYLMLPQRYLKLSSLKFFSVLLGWSLLLSLPACWSVLRCHVIYYWSLLVHFLLQLLYSSTLYGSSLYFLPLCSSYYCVHPFSFSEVHWASLRSSPWTLYQANCLSPLFSSFSEVLSCSFIYNVLLYHFTFALLLYLFPCSRYLWASLVAQLVKNPPAMQETPFCLLSREHPLEKE